MANDTAGDAPSGGTASNLRRIRHSLHGARDEQIIKVVAMVDALADRGAADAIIAPLRPRLAQLRPSRPLRLARLMFLPLERLIVAPARWRPGEPSVPRSAVVALTKCVREHERTLTDEVERTIEGIDGRNEAVIEQAGPLLWAAAARVLPDAPLPAMWQTTGVPAGEFAALARGVGGALAQAGAVRAIVAEAGHGLAIPVNRIETVLAAAQRGGTEAWAMTAALLLAMSDPATVVRALARPAKASLPAPDAAAPAERLAAPVSREQVNHVLRAAVASIEQSGGASAWAGSDLAGAGAELRRVFALLEALDAPDVPPAVRGRLRELRRLMDGRSIARFESGLADELINPLQQPQGSEALDATALEGTARQLRQIEQVGRRLGSAAAYDAALRRTASAVRAVSSQAGLMLADKVRMVEILVGPDEAMALLSQDGPIAA